MLDQPNAERRSQLITDILDSLGINDRNGISENTSIGDLVKWIRLNNDSFPSDTWLARDIGMREAELSKLLIMDYPTAEIIDKLATSLGIDSGQLTELAELTKGESQMPVQLDAAPEDSSAPKDLARKYAKMVEDVATKNEQELNYRPNFLTTLNSFIETFKNFLEELEKMHKADMSKPDSFESDSDANIPLKMNQIAQAADIDASFETGTTLSKFLIALAKKRGHGKITVALRAKKYNGITADGVSTLLSYPYKKRQNQDNPEVKAKQTTLLTKIADSLDIDKEKLQELFDYIVQVNSGATPNQARQKKEKETFKLVSAYRDKLMAPILRHGELTPDEPDKTAKTINDINRHTRRALRVVMEQVRATSH